jgi:hypothetical protein
MKKVTSYFKALSWNVNQDRNMLNSISRSLSQETLLNSLPMTIEVGIFWSGIADLK